MLHHNKLDARHCFRCTKFAGIFTSDFHLSPLRFMHNMHAACANCLHVPAHASHAQIYAQRASQYKLHMEMRFFSPATIGSPIICLVRRLPVHKNYASSMCAFLPAFGCDEIGASAVANVLLSIRPSPTLCTTDRCHCNTLGAP